MGIDGEEVGKAGRSAFHTARAELTNAAAARKELAACWASLCDTKPFSSETVPIDDRIGRLDVLVNWPPDLRERSNSAAAEFARSVKAALDSALLAVAEAVLGAIEPPEACDYVMPLCTDETKFLELLEAGRLAGLRPDQVREVWLLQPFKLASRDSHVDVDLGVALRQLNELLTSEASGSNLTAVWAHSAEPLFASADADAEIEPSVAEDGLLESCRTIATFACSGTPPEQVWTNPQVAFDFVFAAPPYPRDPDDNLMARSALLLALAQGFVRAMERSVLPSTRRRPHFEDLVPALDDPPWGEIDLSLVEEGVEIEEGLRRSDLGIATYYGPDGEVAILLQDGDTTFVRPVPAALPLNPAEEAGPATEEASRGAAGLWGLPDFVFRPSLVRRSRATREIGDCTIVVGARALAIQIKHRSPESGDDEAVEIGRVEKRIRKAAQQASGSIRSLISSPGELVNGRGRPILVNGADLAWCRVVILDHPWDPELEIRGCEHGPLPLVVLLRRDWDFLFDQLRSTAAVVDYVFRVAEDETHLLGHEPARYYELARADADAASDGPAEWATASGIPVVNDPILPTVPASHADAAGATVYRLILEDIAETPFERDERDRLKILEMLDRYPVSDRSRLGRLLLAHLDDVAETTEGVKWQFRRTILQGGRLQLAFGAASSFSDLHREAFGQWAMLRHHDFSQLRRVAPGEEHRTVAVLLTPRFDGSPRLWDTTSFTLFGDLAHSEGELGRMRALWDRRGAA